MEIVAVILGLTASVGTWMVFFQTRVWQQRWVFRMCDLHTSNSAFSTVCQMSGDRISGLPSSLISG